MIIFTKIKWKNILSYGNYWTEIELNKNDLTIIIGKNGSGKSTLLDALSFVLFGKPFRKITKNQIINSVTKKNSLIEIDFEIGIDNYKIIRGIKPDKFEIYKNNVLIPQDSKVDLYQDYLERYILHCNYKSFCQVVVLGSASYIPFLDLKTPQRREIVENILDLEIFSTMNINLKKQIVSTNETFNNLSSEKTILIEQINIINNQNKKLQEDKDRIISSYNQKIIDAKEEIIKINSTSSEMINVKLRIAEHDDKIREIFDKITNINNKLGQLAQAIEQIKKEIEFYNNNDNCPTCKQHLEILFKTQTIENKNKILNDLLQARDKKNEKLPLLSKIKKDFEKEKEELVIEYNRVLEKSSIVKIKENEIRNWIETISNLQKEIENDSGDFEKINSRLLEVNREIDEIQNLKNVEQFILRMLKDDGIKAQIIKQYINLINLLINQYLQDMNFLCQFILDEEFNETIKSRYRDDFSYASFSEGEKLRITLAILFTWREIAKRRNSISTNILFFDEVLSGSLDSDGVEDFIKIIKSLNKNENIFLITHDQETVARSENIIEFGKIQGFSHILSSIE